MNKPQRLRAEQLERHYQSKVAETGQRTQHADGRLTTTASFTTSVKRQERRAACRPDNSFSSTGFASSVKTSEPPNEISNLCPNTAPKGIQPPAGYVNYSRPYSLKSDAEKAAAREATAANPANAPTTHKLRQTRANGQGWTYAPYSEPPKQERPTEASSGLSDRQKRQLKGR